MSKARTKKNNAKKNKKGTLDQKHTEKITKFNKMNKSLPIKKNKLTRLESELEELMNTNPNKYTREDIHRKAYLMDSIEKLKGEINSIENCTESLNYIVNTLPILVNYYDNDELIDDDMETEMMTDASQSGKKTILTYFMKEENEINNKKINNKNSKAKKTGSTNSVSKNEPNKKEDDKNLIVKRSSRSKLYSEYLNVTDVNHRIKTSWNTQCPRPDCNGEKILSQNDSYMVCKKCGLSEVILLPTDKPNYKEPTQDSGTYAYKRINHLTEILSQLQAKESTDIPQKVFENIQRELKKRKIDKNELDIFKLRRILKILNYRKYYEHVPHILQIINGKEPPNFSRDDEMRIKKMFKDIQKPFALYCPKNRKNFLNYSYVLHKFCELLGLDKYINYFPLLKNNNKLLQHDKIWKNICDYMCWESIKSI